MNRIILVIVLISFILTGCKSNPSLEGYWGMGNVYIFQTTKDTFSLVINDAKITGTYKTDFSKNPPQIDLLYKDGSGKNVVLKGIINYVNQEDIELYIPLSPDASRPEKFESKGTLQLKKISDNLNLK